MAPKARRKASGASATTLQGARAATILEEISRSGGAPPVLISELYTLLHKELGERKVIDPEYLAAVAPRALETSKNCKRGPSGRIPTYGSYIDCMVKENTEPPPLLSASAAREVASEYGSILIKTTQTSLQLLSQGVREEGRLKEVIPLLLRVACLSVYALDRIRKALNCGELALEKMEYQCLTKCVEHDEYYLGCELLVRLRHRLTEYHHSVTGSQKQGEGDGLSKPLEILSKLPQAETFLPATFSRLCCGYLLYFARMLALGPLTTAGVKVLSRDVVDLFVEHSQSLAKSGEKSAAKTYLDKMFKILWSAASAATAAKADGIDPLELRLAAFRILGHQQTNTFPYILEQAHRCGIHAEKLIKRTPDRESIIQFYRAVLGLAVRDGELDLENIPPMKERRWKNNVKATVTTFIGFAVQTQCAPQAFNVLEHLSSLLLKSVDLEEALAVLLAVEDYIRVPARSSSSSIIPFFCKFLLSALQFATERAMTPSHLSLDQHSKTATKQSSFINNYCSKILDQLIVCSGMESVASAILSPGSSLTALPRRLTRVVAVWRNVNPSVFPKQNSEKLIACINRLALRLEDAEPSQVMAAVDRISSLYRAKGQLLHWLLPLSDASLYLEIVQAFQKSFDALAKSLTVACKSEDGEKNGEGDAGATQSSLLTEANALTAASYNAGLSFYKQKDFEQASALLSMSLRVVEEFLLERLGQDKTPEQRSPLLTIATEQNLPLRYNVLSACHRECGDWKQAMRAMEEAVYWDQLLYGNKLDGNSSSSEHLQAFVSYHLRYAQASSSESTQSACSRSGVTMPRPQCNKSARLQWFVQIFQSYLPSVGVESLASRLQDVARLAQQEEIKRRAQTQNFCPLEPLPSLFRLYSSQYQRLQRQYPGWRNSRGQTALLLTATEAQLTLLQLVQEAGTMTSMATLHLRVAQSLFQSVSAALHCGECEASLALIADKILSETSAAVEMANDTSPANSEEVIALALLIDCWMRFVSLSTLQKEESDRDDLRPSVSRALDCLTSLLRQKQKEDRSPAFPADLSYTVEELWEILASVANLLQLYGFSDLTERLLLDLESLPARNAPCSGLLCQAVSALPTLEQAVKGENDFPVTVTAKTFSVIEKGPSSLASCSHHDVVQTFRRTLLCPASLTPNTLLDAASAFPGATEKLTSRLEALLLLSRTKRSKEERFLALLSGVKLAAVVFPLSLLSRVELEDILGLKDTEDARQENGDDDEVIELLEDLHLSEEECKETDRALDGQPVDLKGTRKARKEDTAAMGHLTLRLYSRILNNGFTSSSLKLLHLLLDLLLEVSALCKVYGHCLRAITYLKWGLFLSRQATLLYYELQFCLHLCDIYCQSCEAKEQRIAIHLHSLIRDIWEKLRRKPLGSFLSASLLYKLRIEVAISRLVNGPQEQRRTCQALRSWVASELQRQSDHFPPKGGIDQKHSNNALKQLHLRSFLDLAEAEACLKEAEDDGERLPGIADKKRLRLVDTAQRILEDVCQKWESLAQDVKLQAYSLLCYFGRIDSSRKESITRLVPWGGSSCSLVRSLVIKTVYQSLAESLFRPNAAASTRTLTALLHASIGVSYRLTKEYHAYYHSSSSDVVALRRLSNTSTSPANSLPIAGRTKGNTTATFQVERGNENVGICWEKDAIEEFSQVIDKVPSSWTVLSLSLSRDGLIVSRAQRFKQPLVRLLSNPENGGNSVHKMLAEFQELMESNRMSLERCTMAEAATWKAKDKLAWWKTREALDNQLKDLLSLVEAKVFGVWHVLLMPDPALDAAIERQWHFLLPALREGLRKEMRTLDHSEADDAVILELLRLFTCQHVAGRINAAELADGVSQVLSPYFATDTSSPAQVSGLQRLHTYIMAEINRAKSSSFTCPSSPSSLSTSLGSSAAPLPDFSKLKVVELKAELAARGLPTNDRKAVLVQRLIDFELKKQKSSLEDNQEDVKTDHNETEDNPSDAQLILVIDSELHSFPWENLPCLRNTAVSRLPSISFLQAASQRLALAKPFRGLWKNSALILNPSGELKGTEESLQEMIRQVEKEGGQAWIGTAPSATDYMDLLQASSLFIYCGHGGGERYLHRDKLRELRHGAVTVLMGCSSGKLKAEFGYEPWSVVVSHLVAGAPAVIANLWDVTDKDIDKFSLSLLCGPQGSHKTLIGRLLFARDQCRLRYLNGCSPVYYGLPITL